MTLEEYKRKRNFANTPEPSSRRRRGSKDGNLHFVIQQHAAKRLHYDFRLETKSGILKSWAVPKGISLDPSVKRLAIATEDHPRDYISFEGDIPKGSYGAGRVIVWDTGHYDTEESVDAQYARGKIKVTLHGSKANGSFSLVKMKRDGNEWLLTKSRDSYSTVRDPNKTMPGSVLSDRSIETSGSGAVTRRGVPADFPHSINPMLALPVDRPFDKKDWVFEVKWDGVRAISFRNKSENLLDIRSRKGGSIAQRYPEITSVFDSAVKCMDSIIVDGEIVVLDSEGRPDFQRHQRRMNVDSKKDIAIISRELPATYYVFDLLYLDGFSLQHLDFVERRRILSDIILDPSGRIRISDYIEESGRSTFEQAVALKLEGIVAKYKFGRYLQGSRSASWLKIKGVLTQDCVVIGYTRGDGGRRGYFGSLILAVYQSGKLRFVGHTGSGFGFDQLGETLKIMNPLRVDGCPIDHVPYVNRVPAWLKPELVAEVRFNGWTMDGIMRAPIFVRFRHDKKPEECVVEEPRDSLEVVENAKAANSQVVFSNLGKIFWQARPGMKSLTKGDLIDYYERVSSHILPHLLDRPISLSRYPDGILGKSFYHKNWTQHRPDYVRTIGVFSESRQDSINYILCNNRDSLLWLANLGCIEMHAWHSHVHDFSACTDLSDKSKQRFAAAEDVRGLSTPDFIIFDLDPYIYSGGEKGSEPEYTIKGFRAAVEIALALKDLLDGLGIKSYVKTSGKTGLHIFIPVAALYSYDQTREFARIVGRILTRQRPNKITMDWSTAKRRGKVFLDYNQNAMGKTVASIFSVRPTRSATVSMPVNWKDLDTILPTDYTMINVPQILKKWNNPWKHIQNEKQDIGKILAQASELA